MPSYFLTHGLTSAGGRPQNEDSFLYAEAGDVSCWVVADGLGGHEGGATASKIAAESAIKSFRLKPSVDTDSVLAHILAADQALRRQQEAQPALARMRTTIVVLLANPTHAVWGHVGDSRLYYLSAGRIVQQTKDHSVPQNLVEAGEISLSQIRHHEDRSRLLRVLGEDGGVRPTAAEPVALHPGDAFLLCSDGFWENIYETEMELDFAKSRQPSEWLSLLEIRLQERVSGSHDNYTALAIFGDGLPGSRPPLPPIRRTEPVLTSPPPRRRAMGLLDYAVLCLIPIIAVLILVSLKPEIWMSRIFPERQSTKHSVNSTTTKGQK